MGGKDKSKEVDARPEFPTKGFIRGFRACSERAGAVLLWTLVAYISVKLVPALISGDLQKKILGSYVACRGIKLEFNGFALAGMAVVALLLLLWRFCSRKDTPVYCLDFSVYRPPDVLKVSKADCRLGAEFCGKFNQEALDFQNRIAERSGLGEETFLPPGLKRGPFEINMFRSREEAEMVMFRCVHDLLQNTNLKPRDIDILIVNCSLFNPTPSLSAMIINHFKMRSDIISYNLSGMGCSAGVIAVDLARELLQVYPNKYAIVVSTENITQNWYFGNERSFLIPNVLFRMGGAAILMTNRQSDRYRAKYELQHVVRVHMGADDKAYRCVLQRPDSDGHLGVELNKDLVKVASKALTKNLTRLGPLVLPWSEKMFVVLNLLVAKVLRIRVKPYVPDFKTAFTHFCLHAGGRAVIEGLGKQLDIPDEKTEPSLQTLHWYGNTSSSTIWYSLAYAESCQRVQKDDTVWQVGFGSGFKCNSAVWKAVRDVHSTHRAWEHLVRKTSKKA